MIKDGRSNVNKNIVVVVVWRQESQGGGWAWWTDGRTDKFKVEAASSKWRNVQRWKMKLGEDERWRKKEGRGREEKMRVFIPWGREWGCPRITLYIPRSPLIFRIDQSGEELQLQDHASISDHTSPSESHFIFEIDQSWSVILIDTTSPFCPGSSYHAHLPHAGSSGLQVYMLGKSVEFRLATKWSTWSRTVLSEPSST